MSFPYSDTFESYADGDQLTTHSPWVGDTAIWVNSIGPITGSRSVWNTTTGRKVCFSGQDNAGGDVIVSGKIKAFSFASGFFEADLFARCSDTNSPPTSGYMVNFDRSDGSVNLYYLSGGSFNAIVHCTGATFQKGVNYYFELSLSGTALRVRLQDINGTNAGKWLNSSGSFVTDAGTGIYCINTTDTNIPQARGYCGFGLGDESSGNIEQGCLDDYSATDTYATFTPVVQAKVQAFPVITQTATGNITGATNAKPIVITSAAHGQVSGTVLNIASVGGNTAANGTWPITKIDANSFSLNGSDGTSSGTYTAATGTWSVVGVAVTLDSAANLNNTLVAVVATYNYPLAASNPVTDNLGNSWTQLGSNVTSGNNILSAWEVYRTAAGTPTVIFAEHAGSSGYITVMLFELQGIVQSAVDAFASATGSSTTTASPGAISVSAANDFVLTAFSQGNNNIDNATVDSGFTMLGLQTGGLAFECLGVAAKTASSNVTPTFSTFLGGSAQATTWSSLGVSLKTTVTGSVILFEDDMAKYIGDVVAGTVIKDEFNTFISDGTPTTLSGTPTLQVLRDDGTTSTSGVTLTADYNSLTGANHFAIDTSSNSSFYAAGHDFSVQISAGTVGGVSRVGVIPAKFSIENRRADLARIVKTALTETTPGNVAAAFKAFFDVAPTARATINSVTIQSDLLTAAQVATALWADIVASSDFTTTGTIGLALSSLITQLTNMIEVDRETSGYYRFTRSALANSAIQEVINGLPAYDLIGQPTFTSDVVLCSATGIASANGFAFVHSPPWGVGHDYLFVSDTVNNRVLVFDVTYGQVNKAALWVLGQPNTGSNQVNYPSGTPGSQGLNQPTGLAYDAVNNQFWVADTGNNRCLRFDMTTAPVTLQAAIGVVGQAVMTTNASGLTQNTMNQPSDVAYDPTNDRLFVADTNNNRVLDFTTAHTLTTGTHNAAAAIGQADFTHSVGATTNHNTWGPVSVLWDDQDAILFVGEGVADRVTAWDGTAIATNMNCICVPTAPDAVTTGGSTHVNQHFVFVPGRLGWDPVRKWLFVPEGSTGNNRTSIWDFSQGISYGMAASYVIGQSDFTRSSSNDATFENVNQFQSGGHAAAAYDWLNDRLFLGTGTFGGRVGIYQLRRPLTRLVSGLSKSVGIGPFAFVMTDSTTHAPKAGQTVTATVQLDGGPFNPTANSPVNVGNGWYKITLTAADLAGNVVALRFTAATCDDTNVLILTTPP